MAPSASERIESWAAALLKGKTNGRETFESHPGTCSS